MIDIHSVSVRERLQVDSMQSLELRELLMGIKYLKHVICLLKLG